MKRLRFKVTSRLNGDYFTQLFSSKADAERMAKAHKRFFKTNLVILTPTI